MEKQFDVIVAGGGPAGIAASVSAARCGANTALIERYGILGGMMTSGAVHPILGNTAPNTMYQEVCALLNEGHENVPKDTTRNGSEIHVDPEEAKYRLLKLVCDSGVKLYLQTPIADVCKDGNRVTGVTVVTQDGLVTLNAKCVVDSTGDGFVAYRAGAEYHVGRESDGKCQPLSTEFTLENVDEARAITCWGGSDPVTMPDGKKFSVFCREAHDRGELPENVTIVRLHRTFYPGERNVNATQVNGLDSLHAEGITDAELKLRGQIPQIVTFLRKYVPCYENCRVKSSGSTLGVRETRRIQGLYTISDEDVEKGARFADVVIHRAWFLIDIHNPAGGGQAEGHSQPATPYDIPLRSLIPAGLDGLLLSGRCISGTHRAHASYRVMAVCLATGQAAGIAAALCARKGIQPKDLPASEVQQVLTAYGAQLWDKE